MKKHIEAMAEAAAVAHLGKFVSDIAKAVHDFVDVIDPSESDELMKYTRAVLEASDNLVLTACMQTENKEVVAKLRESNDIKIQQLIDQANKDKETH